MSITNDEAMKILESKNLFYDIVRCIGKYLSGETSAIKSIFLHLNKINVGNLSGTKCAKVDGESSAGKNYVSQRVYDIFPKNKKIFRTRLSPRTFDYWHTFNNEPEWNWDDWILYIDQVGDGLLNSDSFKLMASGGSKTTIIINQKAVDLEVRGKPVLLITTSHATPINEIISRFDSIGLNEGADQTGKVFEFQAQEAVDGEIDYGEKFLYIRDALVRLKKKKVKIPYAKELVFGFKNKSLRMRRIFPRFLDLIRSVCVLHQFQRKTDSEGYLIATKHDYEIAMDVFESIKESTVVGLNHQLKRAYEGCLKISKESVEEGGWFTVPEIIAFDGFASRMSWYNYLEQLHERKLLKSKHDFVDDKHKAQFYYPIVIKDKVILPSWKELMMITDHQLMEKEKEKEYEKIEEEWNAGEFY